MTATVLDAQRPPASRQPKPPVRSSRLSLGRRAYKAALISIERRLFRTREPFGVFVRDGAILMVKSTTQMFDNECRRAERAGAMSHLVGVYDGTASIFAIAEDLREFVR